RPLPPEVVLDAIRDATGLPVRYPVANPSSMLAQYKITQTTRVASNTRAIEFYSPQLAYPALGPLAPCMAVNLNCPAEPSAAISLDDLPTQLFWINGEIINGQLVDLRSPQITFWNWQAQPEQAIEECYLRTLSRLPSARELSYWKAQLANAD